MATAVRRSRTRTVVVLPQGAAALDSAGQEFWLAFTENFNGFSDLLLYITSDEDTAGMVEVPGLGFTTPFEVDAGTVTTVVVPQLASLRQSNSDANVARAVHVTADDDVTVYGLNNLRGTTGAFLGLPVDTLGTDYRVLAYPSHGQQVGVVATANDTPRVTVTPFVASELHPAGVPYTEVIDVGEVFVPAPPNFDPGASGARIQSDKPVAVFSGNDCAEIPHLIRFCDHVVEQLTPTSTWGRRFITTPLASAPERRRVPHPRRHRRHRGADQRRGGGDPRRR